MFVFNWGGGGNSNICFLESNFCESTERFKSFLFSEFQCDLLKHEFEETTCVHDQ